MKTGIDVVHERIQKEIRYSSTIDSQLQQRPTDGLLSFQKRDSIVRMELLKELLNAMEEVSE